MPKGHTSSSCIREEKRVDARPIGPPKFALLLDDTFYSEHVKSSFSKRVPCGANAFVLSEDATRKEDSDDTEYIQAIQYYRIPHNDWQRAQGLKWLDFYMRLL